MKLSRGEVLDRYTILQIKKLVVKDPVKQATILSHLQEIDLEVEADAKALIELAVLNVLIFIAVDEIATEPDLAICGTIGKRIQTLNLKRSACKNALDGSGNQHDVKI